VPGVSPVEVAVGEDRELEVRAEDLARRRILLVRVMPEVLELRGLGVGLIVASLVLLE
jgi:hypothetical protein